jgi:hypothetical protein
MEIVLYTTGSERHAISKTLQNALELTGSLRGESSVINPSFIVELSNPSQYNYCFIPDFNRYYFITNITIVRTNIWRFDCSVDVLMSYQTEILNLDVIVSDLSLGESPTETYMQGEQWETSVKNKTDIINFPSGLLDAGEYILITSGGIAS